MRTPDAVPYHADVRVDGAALRRRLGADVRVGLGGPRRSLPPKYFYDAAGSALFDRITRLPEYYLTRAEERILQTRGAELMEEVRPLEIVELGAGSCTKIRWFLGVDGTPARYVPVDVDAVTLAAAAERLRRAYPGLAMQGIIGDFERDLEAVPPPTGRRLVVFLGSTIGNLGPRARRALLRGVRRLLHPGDHVLLGMDLVKDRAVLEAAYDDREGVTADFNRNVLRVIDRALGADFDPSVFRHHARWDERAGRIEMHLIADTRQRVSVPAVGLRLDFEPGDSIWTESSYKFTRAGAESMLVEVGFATVRWLTDPDGLVALVLARAASCR